MPVQARERGVHEGRQHRGRSAREAGPAHTKRGSTVLKGKRGREEAAEEVDVDVCADEVPCWEQG